MYYSDLVNIQYRIDGFLTQKDNPIKKLMVFIVAKGKEDEAFKKSIIERNQHLEGIEVKFYVANEQNKERLFRQITNESIDDSTGYIFFSIADVPCGEFLDFARKIKRCKLLILRECILNDEDFELKISLAYCQVYENEDLRNEVDNFCLAVGYEIEDMSEESLEAGIRNYMGEGETEGFTQQM